MRILKWLIPLAVIIVILSGLLLLDLANRGLAWQFFWSQTGEEGPVAQLRGMVEWAGNLTRPQPLNDSLLPINHTGENPYGMNTFLQREVDPAKVDEQLRLIAEAGFTWIRQEFVWEDIEVDGRGLYTDSRNDMNGDGTKDTIDAWLKYDRIVELAEKHGIQIQARLSNPPDWALDGNDPTGLALPVDMQDYVNFAVETARRYQGRIHYYQIWNEPNIFPEWGAFADGSPRPVDPETYTELLCRTHDALKAVDPNLVVISGALAPTNPLWLRDLNDFVYLERMYTAGAGACFDILSMQGYGLNSGPTDRRMRPTTVNIGRNQYIRDIMVANGDAHKPIWISEAAWNFVPSESEYPDPIEARYNYGQVTMEQAAEYMPLLYQRAKEEWAWVGVINYWYFTQPDDSLKDRSWYYFRMTEPDYSDEKPTYTTLPVYDAMKAYIQGQTPTLYQGVHQLDQHYAVTYDADAAVTAVDGAQFDQALETKSVNFTASGTDVVLRWQGGSIRVKIDDGEVETIDEAVGDWRLTTISSSLLPAVHTVNLEADTPITVDSVMVLDQRFQKWYPLFTALFVGLGMVILAVITGLKTRRL